MATIPTPIHSVARLIDRHHEESQEPPRPHMGASMIGHPCERWLWLSFRWAVVEKFDGRILRLFRRGHNEEATVLADLRAIGLDIKDTGGTQDRVDFGSHVSGSMDGIILSGVPEAPTKKHILEIKTHSKKSFDALLNQGVVKAKPMHFIQMQAYMHGAGIDRALYVAVCKDDDRIYTERVRLDRAHAEAAIQRGKRIATADRMPEPCAGASASWYQCKFCPAYELCHQGALPKEINCRTCAHSTPTPAGDWVCERHGAEIIPTHFQHEGCRSHVMHPDLIPVRQIDCRNDWTAVYENGLANGEDGLATSDFLEALSRCS